MADENRNTENDHSADTYWLAGLLEGEGSFMLGSPSDPNMIRVSLQMTDQEVMVRAASLMGVSCNGPYKPQKSHHKETYKAQAKGLRAARIMRLVRPMMGERRSAMIDRALEGFNEAQCLRRGPPSDPDKMKKASLAKTLYLQGATLQHISDEIGTAKHNVASIVRRRKSRSYFEAEPDYKALAG